jgi:hypothetical protein
VRTSDVIGAVVIDSAGMEIGKAHDLRVARDGRHATEAPYAVTHLLVAAGTVGTRLGYGYGHMHGPWPLSAVIRWALRRGYAVRWDQIASVEPKGRVMLNVAVEQLTSMAELVEESSR